MFGATEKVQVAVGDRVAVIKDQKIVKARVVSTLDDTMVFVTLEKGGDPVAYNRTDVMLLYRYVTTEQGTGVIPYVIAAPKGVL